MQMCTMNRQFKALCFCREHPVVFIKLNDNIISGFSQTQQYVILLYLHDVMFRSPDHHQVIFTELSIHGCYLHCT